MSLAESMSDRHAAAPTEIATFRLTAAERRYLQDRARAELRTFSNLVRSFVVEKMQEET